MPEHCPGFALSDGNAIILLSEDQLGRSSLKPLMLIAVLSALFQPQQSRVKKFHAHLVLRQGANNRLHTSRMVQHL